MALSAFSFPQRSLLCSSSIHSQRGVELFLQSLHRHIQVKKRPARLYASLSERGQYASQRPPTPLLDTMNYPIYLKNLSTTELKQLADEVRSDVIFYVSKTGGHLGSSLGVAELTVALHYVFNAPRNKILSDVGHQSYRHNILTGWMNKMHTMRQTDGFTKRSESQYDCFGVGHSSTTLSPGLGMAVGRDLKGGKNHVVAVGSALSRLQSNRPLRELREVANGVTKQIGGPMHEWAAKVDEYARGMISGSGSTLFEELGLYYIGPVDGHNIDDLVTILKEVESTKTSGPVLIHMVTEKGHGYPHAERAADKYHVEASGSSRSVYRPRITF